MTILAKGLTPVCLTFYSDINTKEHAPSLIFEELAAVIVPVLLNAGAKTEILSYLYLFHY